MTVKQYLQQAFILQKLINAKKSRIQDLRDMQFFIRAAAPGIKVQNSAKADPTGDTAALLLDLISECRHDIKRLLNIQREIEIVVNSVNRPDHRLILYERYINLKHWEDIAADNNYGWDTVHRKHREALKNISIESYTLDVV